MNRCYICTCSDQQTSIYELNQNVYNHLGKCLKNCLVVKNIMIKNKCKSKVGLTHNVHVF